MKQCIICLYYTIVRNIVRKIKMRLHCKNLAVEVSV